MSNDDELEIWTVYDHPNDLPEWWVARRFRIAERMVEPEATPQVLLAKSLSELQATLIEHTQVSVRFPRSEGDDPKIVESWL